MKKHPIQEISPKEFLEQHSVGYRQIAAEDREHPAYNSLASVCALVLEASIPAREKCVNAYRECFEYDARLAVVARHGPPYPDALGRSLEHYKTGRTAPLSEKLKDALRGELVLGTSPRETLALVNGFLVQCRFTKEEAHELMDELLKFSWKHNFPPAVLSIALTNLDVDLPHYGNDEHGRLVRLDVPAGEHKEPSEARLRMEIVPSR